MVLDFLITVARNLDYCPQSSGNTEAQEVGIPSPRQPEATGLESRAGNLSVAFAIQSLSTHQTCG